MYVDGTDMDVLTKAQKSEIRRQKELISPQHDWAEKQSPTFMFFRCVLCGWKVRLRKGAKHNGYTISKDENLRNFLPILDDRGLSCHEKVVKKVMDI